MLCVYVCVGCSSSYWRTPMNLRMISHISIAWILSQTTQRYVKEYINNAITLWHSYTKTTMAYIA